MDYINIDGVSLTPLNNIEVKGGNVLHALKQSDHGFMGFGEAYFSSIDYLSIKAWKKHTEMTLNLIVPIGRIRFVIYDNRNNDIKEHKFRSVILSLDNYCRLTVPPNLWLGFIGLDKKTSFLLNIANIEHDPNEVEKASMEKFNYDWNEEII